jgi:NTE family protein
VTELDNRPKVAVVLAGAVAKGAFEAGALEVLSELPVHVVRIVAASSGALNAVVYGAGVRGGTEVATARLLSELWLDDASLCKVLSAGWGNLRNAGVSNGEKLRALMRDHVHVGTGTKHHVELRIMLTPLLGRTARIGKAPHLEFDATTFEALQKFDGSAYDTAPAREELFTAAVASAAFPLVFRHVDIERSASGQPNHVDLGPCVDGGTTNNAPIGEAIADLRNEITAVIVIAPTVEHATMPGTPDGFRDVLGRVVDMLINERLFRDLRKAEEVNAELTSLDALVASNDLTPTQLDRVRQAIGWRDQRVIPIIRIRPTDSLEGNPFSGFLCRELREQYVSAGRKRAKTVLSDTEVLRAITGQRRSTPPMPL